MYLCFETPSIQECPNRACHILPLRSPASICTCLFQLLSFYLVDLLFGLCSENLRTRASHFFSLPRHRLNSRQNAPTTVKQTPNKSCTHHKKNPRFTLKVPQRVQFMAYLQNIPHMIKPGIYIYICLSVYFYIRSILSCIPQLSHIVLSGSQP